MKLPQNKRWIVFFIVVVILLIARAMAPGIILNKINSYLGDFSETYYAHIDDLDISIWRGAYRFEKINVALKKDGQKPFLTAGVVDVSVAWRALLQGRILTDVIATDVFLDGGAEFTQTARTNPDEATSEAKAVGKTLFPVETERVEIKNSRIDYKPLDLFVNDIEGRLSNVTSTDENPLSLLTLKGSLLGKSAIKVVGNLNFVSDPAAWLFSAELQQLNLNEATPQINRYVPLTFKKGKLDIYAEIKSENSRIAGYVKPFLKDAEVIGDDKDFKSIRHFGVEITVAFLNLFFRSTQDHVLATKFLFTYEKGDFKWNMNEVLSQLFKNGYEEKLSPGIENILSLQKKRNQH